MYIIAAINPDHFKNIFPVLTNDVVITDKQIQHIKERHPQDYECYGGYILKILKEPDYILEASKPNSVLLLKEFLDDDERFQLVLRLKTLQDPSNYENSVITFLRIRKKEWCRLKNNKKILYKAE